MIRIACALLVAMPLAGCFNGAGVPDLAPQPAPAELATPQGTAKATAVAVPTSCKQQQVDHQYGKVVDLSSAKAAWKYTDHLLSIANGRIKNADACIDQQAAEYAKGFQGKAGTAGVRAAAQ